MKKILSVLLSIIIVFSQAMPHVQAASIWGEDSVNTFEMGQIEAEGNGTIGNLLADTIEDELEKKATEDGVAPDCDVLDVSVEGNTAEVSFRTDRDAELIVAIYDENYIEMYAQGSALVTDGETAKTITLEIGKEDMPAYFCVQAFLVEPEGKRPLCVTYKSSHYTQKMQEFFAATINDFPGRAVVNFDNDSTNNFAVFAEGTILIEEATGNCKVTDTADGTYTFSNAPDELCKAKIGDVVGYRSNSGEITAIKIKTIQVDQTTVYICEADVELGELFSYIKIDTDLKTVSDSETDEASGISASINAVGEVEAPLVWKYHIADLPILESKKDDENKLEVSGDFKIELMPHFTYFYDINLFKEDVYEVEFSLDYTVELELALSGKGRIKFGFDIPVFTVLGIVNVTLDPSLTLEFTADLTLKAPLEGSFGASESSDNGFKNLCTKPAFTPRIEVEGKIFVGLALSPKLTAFKGTALDMKIEGMVGTTISASKSTTDISEKKIHSCGLLCISGDISYHVKLGYEVKIANSKKLTFSNEIDWQIGESIPFYYSIKYKEFAFTTCPHEAYKINLQVLTMVLPTLECGYLKNATISCQESNLCVKQGGVAQTKEFVTTNDKGKTVFYLPSGKYTLKITNGKDINCSRKITVKKDEQSESIMLVSLLEDPQKPNTPGGESPDAPGGENPDAPGGEEPDTPGGENPDTPGGEDPDTPGGENPDAPGDDEPDTPGSTDGSDSDSKWKNLIVKADTYAYEWSNGGIGISADDGAVYKSIIRHLSTQTDRIPEISVSRITDLAERGARFDGSHVLISENGNAYRVYTDETIPVDFAVEGEKIKAVLAYPALNDTSPFYCVFTESGKIYTWGSNKYRLLGNGESSTDFVQETPYLVLENVDTVQYYGQNIYAITKDRKLYIWGGLTGNFGGGRDFENPYTPYLAFENVQEVHPSSDYVLVLTADGKLYNWGSVAQLGQGNSQGTTDTCLPCLLLENVKKVEKSSSGNYAVLENGDLYTWMITVGNLNYGQTGHGSPYGQPMKILDNVADVSINGWEGYARTKTGELYIWGTYNGYDLNHSPVKVLDGVKDVTYNGPGVLAVKQDGSLWTYKQIRNEEDEKEEVIEQISVGKSIDSILDIQEAVDCIPLIAEDGTLYCFIQETDMAIPIKSGIKGVLYMTIYSFKQNGEWRYGVDSLIINPDNSLVWNYTTADGVTAESVFLENFRLPGSYVEAEDPAGSTDGDDTVGQISAIRKTDSSLYTETGAKVQQAIFQNLYPNEIYNFYVTDKDGIRYISQHKTEANGELTIKYRTKENTEDAEVYVARMNKTQIKEVTVTMPRMYSTGEAVEVAPNVSLDGEKLTHGIDYTIYGDCHVADPGVYQLTIEGIGDYYGSVTVEFTVKDAQDEEWGDLAEEEDKGFDHPQQVPNGLWVKGITEGMSVTYTGKAVTLPLQVYNHTKRLVAGKDYTISYKNNKNVANESTVKPSKVPTVTITGKGNYSGKKVYHFSIESADITSAEFEIENLIVNQKSAVQYPVPVVKWNGKTLKKNTDYKVTYPSISKGKTAYKDEGTYEIVVSGCGNFTGTRKVSLEITNKTLIGKLKVAKISTQIKEGDAPIEPELKISDKKYVLQKGTDYTCEYINNKEIGTATVKITGKGKYAGSKSVSFKIVGTSIAKATVTGLQSTYEYTGTGIEPANVELSLNGKKLQKDIDYTITYPGDKNKNAGTAVMQFNGINNYSGSIRKNFKITPYNISEDYSLKVKLYHEGKTFQNVMVAYEKGGTKPVPEIWFSGTELKQGVDFRVSYKDNKTISDQKTSQMIISGKGNFKGTISKEFTIISKDIGELQETSTIPDKMENGTGYSVPVVCDLNGKALKKGVDYSNDIVYTYAADTALTGGLSRKAGETVAKEDKIPAGTVIHATIRGTGNYQGGLTLSYRVVKYDIAKAKVSVDDATYKGENLPPTKDQIHVTMVIAGKEKELEKEDFEIVSVRKGTFINKGKYQIVIRGCRGEYGGIKKTYYNINPQNNWF